MFQFISGLWHEFDFQSTQTAMEKKRKWMCKKHKHARRGRGTHTTNHSDSKYDVWLRFPFYWIHPSHPVSFHIHFTIRTQFFSHSSTPIPSHFISFHPRCWRYEHKRMCARMCFCVSSTGAVDLNPETQWALLSFQTNIYAVNKHNATHKHNIAIQAKCTSRVLVK